MIALGGWSLAEDPVANNLAGVGWFLFGPAIPGVILSGAGLLGLGSAPFTSAAPRLQTAGWASLGALVLSIIAGFFLFGTHVGTIVMFTMLVVHPLVVLALVVAAVRDGRMPWEAGEPDGERHRT